MPSRSWVALAGILWAMPAFAEGNRVQVTLGLHWGHPEVQLDGRSRTLPTDTGFGGSLAFWRDGFLRQPAVSVGFEWLHLRGSHFTANGSDSELNGTALSNLDVEPRLNALLVNVVYRDNRSTTRWHPYLGFGLGAAKMEASIDVRGQMNVGGMNFPFRRRELDGEITLGKQVLLGVDYDVTENLYLGLSGRYVNANADLFGGRVKANSWFVGFSAGLRF